MLLEEISVTIKFSESFAALSLSLSSTPAAALRLREPFSATVSVSLTAAGPTPVTVMTKFTVLVAVPSLTVYANVSVAVCPAVIASAPAWSAI